MSRIWKDRSDLEGATIEIKHRGRVNKDHAYSDARWTGKVVD